MDTERRMTLSACTFLLIKQAPVIQEVNLLNFYINQFWTTQRELDLELEPEPPS